MTRRWRPSLAFVLGGALAGTLALSFSGLVALRYLGPAVGFANAAMGLGALIASATALLGWLLWRLLLRPIQALEAYALAHQSGDAPQPPNHFGTRELHATALRVIAMTEALRDRETTIRSFTDHVTHELKTPVSAIRAAAELLIDGGDLNVEDARLLAQIDGARLQLESQLAALRRAAQARELRYDGHCTPDDLTDLVTRLSTDPALRISAQVDCAMPISVEAMDLILGHLLQNAAQHGASHVSLSGSDACLLVSDDGNGVSPGNAPHLFKPFFTTRRETGGTGMGLAIIHNILSTHGGKITLVPSDKGVTFKIAFQ